MTTSILALEADALELKAKLEDLETLVAFLPSETNAEMKIVGEAFAMAEKLANALADLKEGAAPELVASE
ncbi:hypothetical protein LY56_02913 [Roseinatronobacter thiooxidans]|uniref:Uncharacterized protein n=1 Tax=Roseinatronobacter thiooxidans TaxID=121821 RepID=A0A2W7PZZ0_9RHOB|nr:hypothetical protein [Roseinatronobacter thiooxidans]PZX39380.1 hypothetical protein LY56_02913 [Roseinatronobacter thiooxidans]